MTELEGDDCHKLGNDLLGKKHKPMLKLVGEGRRGWGQDVCMISNFC